MDLFERFYRKISKGNSWARPKMPITFRAEVMPGRSREERTFRVEKVLPSGRVTLQDFIGEHRQSEFETVKFEGEKR